MTLLLKADLHQHLEAAGSYAMYQSFAEEAGIEIAPDFTPEGFTFTSLPEFFKAYDYINETLIKTADQYYRLTKDYLLRMRKEGVMYSDLMVSPAHGIISGVEYPDLIDAISCAIEEANSEVGIFATISLTSVRGEGEHYGPEQAARWAREAARYKARGEHRYITSFGLAGNEHYGDFTAFRDAFVIAGDAGLVRRAHAGEGTSAAGIREALDVLNIEVIDHGSAMVEDTALMQEVAERGIGVTVIPTSNRLLNVHTGPDSEHPLWEMHKAGVTVSIGGDDNYFFNTSCAQEYALIQTAGGLSDEQMLQFTINGIYMPLVPEWMRETILTAYPQLKV